MNRILLSLLAAAALSCPMTASQAETAGAPVTTTPVAPAAPVATPTTPSEHHEAHHHKAHHGMSATEMAKKLEDEMTGIKDTGLTGGMKVDFDYNIKATALEIETLKNPDVMYDKKHFASGNRHLNAAKRIVQKHDKMAATEKKKHDRMEAKATKAAEAIKKAEAKAEAVKAPETKN